VKAARIESSAGGSKGWKISRPNRPGFMLWLKKYVISCRYTAPFRVMRSIGLKS